MKMVVLLYFFLSIVILICKGLRVLGPSGPLTVQPGGSVMLPCYVDTPIPVEELEVEWRRTDSDTIVHLFQDGESQPESQDQEYHDRARLFTEEVAHGNFSLLLTDMTVKDTGVYKCVVYRNQESNEMMVEIKMTDYLTVSGGHVVSAHVGEDVTLTCSVHSHIAPEQIDQVSWKKMDEDIVVLLFAQGEIQLDLTHERYTDRVELFNIEEIHKGNFSLRLKNIQTEDKGLYICEALHEALFANTTVEVLQLGLSAIYKLELFLCTCVCLCGISLLLICIPWPSSIENRDYMIKIQHGLIFCPNVIMFIAFILWGQLEGFFNEVTVCSAVNLLRIFQLLNFTPVIDTFKVTIQLRIKRLTSLEYPLLYVIVYSMFGIAWPAEQRLIMTLTITMMTMIFIGFILTVVWRHKLPFTIGVCLYWLFDIGFGLMFCMSFVFFVVDLRGNIKDMLGLIFVNVFLFILTVLAYTEIYLIGWKKRLRKQPLAPFSRLCMCGVAVLFLMNSLTLSVELILSARNGIRIMKDLQVILLPFEWVFAIGYIIAIFVVEFSEQKYKEEDTKERNEEAVELKHVEQSTSPPLGHEEPDLQNYGR